METLTPRVARRLALTRAGLLRPAWTGLRDRVTARTSADDIHAAALAHVARPGYLQLDTVKVSGARSHGIVLASRLAGFKTAWAESLLRPGSGLFEYWGHEASWIPTELYPAFAFRRAAYRVHPWWGDMLGQHPREAQAILARIRAEGPLQASDFEGSAGAGFWDLDLTKKIMSALWSAGELAIRERRGFLRYYDLSERVIPARVRARDETIEQGLRVLLLRALAGHGWATTTTLAETWRLRNRRPAIRRALAELQEAGEICQCALQRARERPVAGWIRRVDLELAARLRRARPRPDLGVLLSPFDPVLWDRKRVQQLFGFEQVLEIFKPAKQRVYGYYCLPVLAGDRLVGRVDLKAHARARALELRALHYEPSERAGTGGAPEQRAAVESALARFADSVALAPPRLPI